MPAAPSRLAAAALVTAALLAIPPRAARAGSEAPDDDGAPFACGKPGAKFAVAFKEEVALPELVTWAMGFSCKRFVYTSALTNRSAKLTLITPGKLDAGEAWAVFEVGLEAMGLTAVPKGGVLELVEAAGAKDAALAIRRSFPDGGGGAVRLLLKPQHVPVEDLRAALELVKSRNGVVTSLANLHALLVTDDGRHVARMKTLVDELDRPSDGAGVWAVPVQFRDAAALIEVLKPLLEPVDPAAGPAGKSTAPRLVADRRVNTVFVVGSAADHTRVASLVDALDRDQGDDAQMSAFRLRNARATEVVAAMQPLLSASSNASAQGGSGAAVSGPVKVSADDGTNAVLVLASARDTLAVRAMLDELDAPRRQIYLEAMVLEVATSNGRDVGVSWHGGQDTGTSTSSGLAFGALQADGLSSVFASESVTSAGAGFIGGLIGSPLTSTLLGDTVPSLGMLIKASATSSNIEVLSSPHVMTLDNKKATISVGSNIPFKTRNASTSELVSTGPQIDRQNVALTLEITPHVAPAGPDDAPGEERIRLDIDLEHNQLGESDFEGLGPTWKERKLTTSVVLRDQDNLVLGGLIDERVENSVDSIPILGALPILGGLFRSTHKIRTKSNLLIVITPHLIDDSAAGRALFERRMRERQEFLRARSALSTEVAAPRVDYGKKRGLVAEIDASVRAVEAERALRAAIKVSEPPRGRVDVAPAPAGR